MSTHGEAVEDIKKAKNVVDAKNIMIQPKDTSRGHFYVSLVKSAMRIVAGAALICIGVEPEYAYAFIKTAGVFFIVAELLGIVEELV